MSQNKTLSKFTAGSLSFAVILEECCQHCRGDFVLTPRSKNILSYLRSTDQQTFLIVPTDGQFTLGKIPFQMKTKLKFFWTFPNQQF
jgi:hypothetical protein